MILTDFSSLDGLFRVEFKMLEMLSSVGKTRKKRKKESVVGRFAFFEEIMIMYSKC